MGETLIFREQRKGDHFKIDYPYYGLFGSADITAVPQEQDEVLYECRLLNGNVIHLKKQVQLKKWIDLTLNRETSLSYIIGTAIDDFLKELKA